MTPSKPRRVKGPWFEGAPEYILDIFDCGGDTVADRYTICFGGSLLEPALLKHGLIWFLGMSEGGVSVSMWGEMDFKSRHNLKKRIAWKDLSEATQKHIIMRAEASQ